MKVYSLSSLSLLFQASCEKPVVPSPIVVKKSAAVLLAKCISQRTNWHVLRLEQGKSNIIGPSEELRTLLAEFGVEAILNIKRDTVLVRLAGQVPAVLYLQTTPV